MKFLTYREADRTFAGLVYHGNQVVALERLFFLQFRRPFRFRDLGDLLRTGGMKRLREIDLSRVKEDRRLARPLRDVEILAPVLRPPKVVCVGLNYRDHAREQNQPVPERPLLFCKAANSVIGPNAAVRLPKDAPDHVDYEVELAVVIGTGGGNIPVERAQDHIFGYTILNDVTARDVQKADRQWFRGKSFRTFAPLGPWIVTPETLSLADGLRIEMRVNGEKRQSSSTHHLIFGPHELVAYVSRTFDLEPGDVIGTGTPAGVGVFREPPVFLRPGDEMEAEIERIGVLRNPVA